MFKLAIVGRPNVGKSALFNRICNKRMAIVDQEEGITRDRLYSEAEIFGVPFKVIDTGGLDSASSDPFKEAISVQTEIAIAEADALIMVVDAQVGLTQPDQALAQMLHQKGKPIVLAINKIDEPSHDMLTHGFYPLGISKMIGISALHNYQIAELLQAAIDFIPQTATSADSQENPIKVSIIGRPNVGKSTLVNALLEKERCVVSELAGTTRDSVENVFSVNQQDYLLIDTAGIRRKKSERAPVEKFAAIRTEKTIERSDICILLLDATQGITEQEKRIAKQIEKAGKGCVIVMNKWDLVSGCPVEPCLRAIREQNPFLKHCPVLFISAKTGRNLKKIFSEIDRVYAASKTKISTPQLNTFIQKSMQLNHPPMLGGKRLRIYYMTQLASQPPHFILFVNKTTLMSESYKKYLINQFRDHYHFPGTPLKFSLRSKEPKK
ncbi:MAG: ribosome biogenesis GTPase Der [Chlamydiales bacterium]